MLKLLTILFDLLLFPVPGKFNLINLLKHVGSSDFLGFELADIEILSCKLLLGCLNSSLLCTFNFLEAYKPIAKKLLILGPLLLLRLMLTLRLSTSHQSDVCNFTKF